jgi:hypothetical protein
MFWNMPAQQQHTRPHVSTDTLLYSTSQRSCRQGSAAG